MPLIEYKCKYCYKAFNNRKNAVECEKSHLTVLNAKAVRYFHGPYPVHVEVKFSDGTSQIYLREADNY